MRKMRLAIFGLGYVGLCTGVTFAEKGHSVICVDLLKERVDMVNEGASPIYEQGLGAALKKVVKKKMLAATLSPKEAVETSDISFICVGTPAKPDGSIDLRFIERVAEDIGRVLHGREDYHLVAMKSTVVPGTTQNLVLPMLKKKSGKDVGKDFGLCVNPEFLKEGSALSDSKHPDRIVVGGYDERSGDILMKLYSDFKCPKLRTDLTSAEMIKYASNAFLAMKISYSNEMANICEMHGIDVYEVMKGVGLDERINPLFLKAGVGFGGSCFPKDLKALITAVKGKGYEPALLETTLKVNEYQPSHLVSILEKTIGSLKGKKVALLGLSFKPETDDVRESRAIPIVNILLEKGAEIIAYDPKAMQNFREVFKENRSMRYADTVLEAVKGADACIIQSDWEEFRKLKPGDFKSMKNKVIIDGRRTLDPIEFLKEGIVYRGIGWKNR